MKIQDTPPLHLTYCLNVHPGESWQENLQAIEQHAGAVRQQVCPSAPFGLGLRLSAAASETLADGRTLRDFAAYQADHGLYTFTINGFPYGRFHGGAVKENVYRPDWTDSRRRDYTIRLANILAELMGPAEAGSISTVPCSYKGWITSAEGVRQMSRMLADTAMHLDRLHQASGRCVRLALEPEPDCFLETTAECLAFLTGPLLADGTAHLKGVYGVDERSGQEILQRHVGVCFDTAHLAVQFEDLAASLRRLLEAGAAVPKVQLSSALSLTGQAPAADALAEFLDEVYLHQVKARLYDGRVLAWPDLGDAIAAGGIAGEVEEWRVHFHVPLFWDGSGRWQSTGRMLGGEFADLLRSGATQHLEIETYTFDVLPERLRSRQVTDSIVEEFRWSLRMLQ